MCSQFEGGTGLVSAAPAVAIASLTIVLLDKGAMTPTRTALVLATATWLAVAMLGYLIAWFR